MYLNEKKLILGLLDTMYEAMQYIEDVGLEVGGNVLADCIDGMQVIEGLLKKEANVPKSQEGYCILCTQFIGLVENQGIEFKVYIKEIKQNLLIFKSIVDQEVIHQLKMVFLPYKAAMWTSFESVYKAAQEDSQCHPVVMPIPYYEKDYANQKMVYQYEGNEFPVDIEVTHYETYDLEAEKPDVIFIHNPYDDQNTITTVAPQYFTKYLARYTSKLVYIPYFIMGPINMNLPLPPHVKIPIIDHVNHVIVQSDRVKELHEMYNGQGEKFIALGSPKADAVIENMKNPAAISEVWQQKLKGKKVFLYNTHISTIPKMGEKAIEMFEETIKAVTQFEECAIIWRPHPLTDIMVKTYAPQYMADYEALKERIHNMPNALIDKNASYMPAFAVADALISVPSSLIREFMLTEKPVLMCTRRVNEEVFRDAPVNLNCNYFWTPDETPLDTFIEMIKEGNDFKKEERVKTIKEALLNSDGTCGKKVYDYVKDLAER